MFFPILEGIDPVNRFLDKSIFVRLFCSSPIGILPVKILLFNSIDSTEKVVNMVGINKIHYHIPS